MKKLTDFRRAVEAAVDPLRQMSESVVRPDWPTVFHPYQRRLGQSNYLQMLSQKKHFLLSY